LRGTPGGVTDFRPRRTVRWVTPSVASLIAEIAARQHGITTTARGRLERCPGELLLAVVVVGDRPDHVTREGVRALDQSRCAGVRARP
jgi:hypothetical protein